MEKYEEIKEIALKSINELKGKIVSCHRVIMNQQLGLSVEGQAEESMDQASLSPAGEGSNDKGKPMSVKQLEEGCRSSVRSSKIRGSAKNSEQDVSQITDENANLKNLSANFSDPEKWRLVDLILKQTEFLLDDKIISEIDALPNNNEKTLRRLDLLMKIFSIKTMGEASDWLFKIHLQCMNFDEQRYDEDLMTISRLLEAGSGTSTTPRRPTPRHPGAEQEVPQGRK